MIEWFLWGLLALIPLGILVKVGLSLKDPVVWKVKEIILLGGILVLAGKAGLFAITVAAVCIILMKITQSTKLGNWLNKEIK